MMIGWGMWGNHSSNELIDISLFQAQEVYYHYPSTPTMANTFTAIQLLYNAPPCPANEIGVEYGRIIDD